MKKPEYRQRRIYAGSTIDVINTYRTQFGDSLTRKNKTGKGTRLEVENYNREMSVRTLRRIIAENFKPDDYFIGLTYEKNNRPKTVDEAKAQVKKFLLKTKKLYDDNGIEFGWLRSKVAFGERGAIHHHVILPQGVSRQKINKIWQDVIKASPGSRPPDFTPLYYDDDFSALASYIIGQEPDTADERYDDLIDKFGTPPPPTRHTLGWSHSRNVKTKFTENEKTVEEITWNEPIIPPSGYVVATETIRAGINPVTNRPYLFYTLVKMRSDFECWTDGDKPKRLSGKEAIKYFRNKNKNYINQNWATFSPDGDIVFKNERKNE